MRAPIQGCDPSGCEYRSCQECRIDVLYGIHAETLGDGICHDAFDLGRMRHVRTEKVRIISHKTEPLGPGLLALAEVVELLSDLAGVVHQYGSKGFDWRLLCRSAYEVGSQLQLSVGIRADDRGLFRVEIVEECAWRDIGEFGDVFNRDAGHAPLGYELERGIAKCAPGRELLSITSPDVGALMIVLIGVWL